MDERQEQRRDQHGRHADERTEQDEAQIALRVAVGHGSHHPNRTMNHHPGGRENARVDKTPDLADAALAAAAAAFSLARIPLRVAAHLPGVSTMAREGAAVRGRLRSRLEGLVEDALGAPEVTRVIDRAFAGRLPDAIVTSLLEQRVPERIAAEIADSVDLDVAITTALDHETTQQIVQTVLLSPGFDRLLVQATDRALNGPEMQRVIEHVAASPEVREALTRQSATLADEMVTGVRTRAEVLDDAVERTVRGWLRRPRPA